jgi:hypothetical protein
MEKTLATKNSQQASDKSCPSEPTVQSKPPSPNKANPEA